jgi:hypothetical protein
MDGELTTRDVAARRRARDGGVAGSSQRRSPIKLIGVKGTADLHRRLRVACAEDGQTSAELIDTLLDLRDAHRQRLLAACASGRVNPLAV